jgi:hypothetical protein
VGARLRQQVEPLTYTTTVRATGSGAHELRLVIEGCREEWCTTDVMAGDLSGSLLQGRRRVGGLKRQGLTITESIRMADAELNVEMGSASIVEQPQLYCTQRFSSASAAVCVLTANATTSDTTLTVDTSTVVDIDDVIHIGTEAMRVTAKPTSTTITVVRGVWDTTAQAHFREATGTQARTLLPEFLDTPITWIGRRFWLYAHGADQLGMSETGEIISRGIIKGDPQLDGSGTTWTLPLGSRWDVLDQSVGSSVKPTLRGIYYCAQEPLVIAVFRHPGATLTAPSARVNFLIAGYFATNAAFCEFVTSVINADATIASWGVRISLVEDGMIWRTIVRIGATAQYVEVTYKSSVDGRSEDGNLTTIADAPAYVQTVTSNTDYWIRNEGQQNYPLRSVPRTTFPLAADPADRASAVFGRFFGTGLANPDTSTNALTAYPARFYLSDVAAVIANSVLLVSKAGADSLPVRVSPNYGSGFVSIDEVIVYRSEPGGETFGSPTRNGLTEDLRYFGGVGADLEFSIVANVALRKSFIRMLQDVITLGPDSCNGSSFPLVTDDDIDTDSTVFDRAGVGVPRRYSHFRDFIYSQSTKLKDVVIEECKASGVFPYLAADGRVAFRPLTNALITVASLGSSDFEGGGPGTLRYERDLVTTVKLSTLYDPEEDSHNGRPYTLRDIRAESRMRRTNVLEIEPKSVSAVEQVLIDDVVLAIASPVLGVYAQPRISITRGVSRKFEHLRIGDAVLITIPQLPYAGARGMSSVIGRVVARSDDRQSPFVQFTFQISMAPVAGYAPQLKAIGFTGPGTIWEIDVAPAEYSDDDKAFFEIGQRVQLVEYDVDVPSKRTGTIQDIGTSTILVEFDASHAAFTGSWRVHYQDATTTNLRASQLKYATVSGSDGITHFFAGDRPARQFAP